MNVFWFRRDLRLYDNAGLYHALKEGKKVIPIFIFDRNILDKLSEESDARVTFIHDAIAYLKEELQRIGSDLKVFHGFPDEVFNGLIKRYPVESVYTNRDYESYALERDRNIEYLLTEHNIAFKTFKDHVIFEANEVTKDNGDPYVVFTPYKRKWLAKLNSQGSGANSYYFKAYPNEKYQDNYSSLEPEDLISLAEMNFKRSNIEIPSDIVKRSVVINYDKTRNFPAIEGTSRLGIHFRFGTISIREKARSAYDLNDTFLSELVWRDFYSSILQSFPAIENHSFRVKYDEIEWRNNEKEFAAWCAGKTGYPIVDAGMRELNRTGYMHNRVRMITASFLTKHLLIDWRWGEAYFAEKLLDFDLASNNGGWQWAAGSGTDAAPYFRIFNPSSQMEKFDKQRVYIKEFVPEFGTDEYPDPIVDHKEARERCLTTYKAALQ